MEQADSNRNEDMQKNKKQTNDEMIVNKIHIDIEIKLLAIPLSCNIFFTLNQITKLQIANYK